MADWHLPPANSSSAQTGAEQSSIRPRNRRTAPAAGGRGYGRPTTDGVGPLSSTSSASASRAASPRPPPATAAAAANAGTIGQFLGDSLSQSWNSVQGFASALFPGTRGEPGALAPAARMPPSRSREPRRAAGDTCGSVGRKQTSWGPAPPSRSLGPDHIAAGSLAEREAALRAVRTASVLESHDNVNGGLDVAGKHKRRNSDAAPPSSLQPDDCLAYIHRVQAHDTYAGIVLRYKCREDAFRRSNGLWSRDSVQTRKWLAIPVDACEVRGRPCDAPSWHSAGAVDLLAPTPAAAYDSPAEAQDDFFASRQTTGGAAESVQGSQDEDRPWTHVRWVQIESIREPVQIGRVSRQALGYFPPRRRKSIRTVSPPSSPRQSSDLSSLPPSSAERPLSQSPSVFGGVPQSSGTASLPRSRVGSDTVDSRPAWMRRPGGVGSMGRSTRTPGPDKDYFNSWARKHLPALNIEGLPSMSVMGSETARFGFASEPSGIVESPFEEGRDTASTSRQGSGLDRAAATVESWLRGALAKRPTTPLVGGRASRSAALSVGLSAGQEGCDLIELADTGSDDGGAAAQGVLAELVPDPGPRAASGR